MSGVGVNGFYEGNKLVTGNLDGIFWEQSGKVAGKLSKIYTLKEVDYTKVQTTEELEAILDKYDLEPDNKYDFEAVKLGLIGYEGILPMVVLRSENLSYHDKVNTQKNYMLYGGLSIFKEKFVDHNTKPLFKIAKSKNLKDGSEELGTYEYFKDNFLEFFQKKGLNYKDYKGKSLYIYNTYLNGKISVYGDEPAGFINFLKDRTLEPFEGAVPIYYYYVTGVLSD